MDIEYLWEKAQKNTEIIRGRIKALATFEYTNVPYLFLAESVVNEGHTLIRKGKVIIDKPIIFLPEDMPQFEGFDFEEEMGIEHGAMQMFFFMRGIRFPSFKYNNTVDKLDVEDSSLAKCVEKYKQKMEQEENVNTALIIGTEDSWQFSVIIYIAMLISRCARNDIANLMNRFKDKW